MSASTNLTSTDLLCIAAPWGPAVVSGIAWALGNASAGPALVAAGVAAVLSLTLHFGITRHRKIQSPLDAAARRLLTELGVTPGAGEANSAANLSEAGNEFKQRMTRLQVELANRRAVFDAAASAFLVTDHDGRLILTNRAAEAFFERADTTMIGRNIEELFTQAEVLSAHASSLRGEAKDAQFRLQRPGGPFRIIQVLTCPVPLAREAPESPRAGVLISLRDVTQLALADQLKTDFVANASHELRTPLSSIKAAIETLSDGAWDDAHMRERLSRMTLANIARLEAMVRDLLDLSRLESAESPFELEEIDLPAFCSALVEYFEAPASERSLEISISIDPRVRQIRTDPRLLELILRNLVDNATKFAYESTTIKLIAQPLADVSNLASLSSPLVPRPGLRLQVVDKGIGIPLGHQQRIFERFFQSDAARTGASPTGDSSRRGTGLGLAIVKHAVKALGGTIGVESVWKQGTSMTVEIPGCVVAVQE